MKTNHLHPFWLPIIAYFLLGLQYFQPNMGGSGTDKPVNLVGWFFIGISIAIALFQIKETKKLRYNGGLIFGLIALFCAFIPLLYPNSYPQVSTYFRLTGLALVFLLLFCSLQFRITQHTRDILLLSVFICCCIQLLLAIFQKFILFHPFAPFGHFQQVNSIGSFLVTGYAITFYFASQNILEKRGFTVITIYCFLLGVLSVYLNSRITLISAFLVTLAGLIFCLRTKKYHLLVLPTLLLSGFLIANQINPNLATVSDSVSHLTTYNVREILYPQVLGMITQNFWFGVGYGNFESAYTLYSAELAKTLNDVTLVQHNFDHPHNEVLYWFSEGGALAGLMFLAVYAVVAYKLLVPLNSDKLLAIAIITPVSLHSLVEYPFHSSLVHLLLAIVLLRILIFPNATVQRVKVSQAITMFMKPAGLTIVALLGLFSVTGLHTIKLVAEYEKFGGISPKPFTNIINPLVLYDRYWSAIMAHKAQMAVNQNNIKGVNDYVVWLENTILHQPRKVYFENLIRLSDEYEMHERKTINCQKFELIFPEESCADILHSSEKISY